MSASNDPRPLAGRPACRGPRGPRGYGHAIGGPGRAWTATEDATLKVLWEASWGPGPERRVRDLMALLGRSRVSIWDRVKRRGLVFARDWADLQAVIGGGLESRGNLA